MKNCTSKLSILLSVIVVGLCTGCESLKSTHVGVSYTVAQELKRGEDPILKPSLTTSADWTW
jgi:hypothetical protein